MDHYKITAFFVLLVLPNALTNCPDDKGEDKDEYCTNHPQGPNNEVRMLLIGKTGVGKSSTGNTILGFRAFHSKMSALSVTSQTQYNETDRYGKRLVVVDTPGLFDTNRTEEETLIEICKWHSLVSPGIHAILLVVEVGRFTDEEQKTVDFFMKIFGDGLKDYLIVVFTHKDRLEEENMTIDEFVQTMNESSNLRKLIKASKERYTAIGYKGKEEDRVQEVKQILSMVEEIVGKDGENYYSNEVFKRVRSLLDENERKRKEEIEKQAKEKMYSREEVSELLNSVRAQARVDIVNNNNQGLFSKLLSFAAGILFFIFGR